MRPEDLKALQAAGLYDPAAPDASRRLELLEWLTAQTGSVEHVIESAKVRPLTGMAGDLLLRGRGERFSIEELAVRSGVTVERIEKIRLAVGLRPVKADDKRFGAEDVEVYRGFDTAAKIFGEAATLQVMRVVGSSLTRIAEAMVSMFLVNIEGPIVEAGGDDLALAKANLAVIQHVETIPAAIDVLLPAHLELAIERMRSARAERSVDLVRMTVGFVDLVGFTSLSRKLSARELADTVVEFEALANDVVARSDGRLVKFIGDEVMFVALDAAAACGVALTLIERFSRDAAVSPRGGLAAGELLMRGGDYYGPVVNLASRIADLAVPREVLVTQEVVAQAGAALRFEAAGKRMLKGFDEPVALYAAARV